MIATEPYAINVITEESQVYATYTTTENNAVYEPVTTVNEYHLDLVCIQLIWSGLI